MCWLCANPETPAVKYACDPVGAVGTGSGSTFEGPSGGGDTIGGTIGGGNIGTLTLGGSVNGVVDISGDQDLFAITVTAGQAIRFNLNGTAYNGASALPDTTLTLLNSAGTQLAFNDDSNGLFSQLTYTFSTAGTYYLRAAGYNSNTGGYQLTATATTGLPVFTIPQISDQLTSGYWTYSGGGARHWGAGNTDITFNVAGLTAERATLARLAFATWSDVCGLTFTETAGAAEITLDDTDSGGAYASSTVSGGVISSSTINVAPNWFSGSSAIDSYTLQTFIHEIGHTLGLGHGGNYNGSATYGVNNHYQNDTWQYSIMSYMEQANFGGATTRYVFTPQMADIYAVQGLYGASTAHSGNTTYGFNVSGLTGLTATLYTFSSFTTAPSITIFDASGTDTLDVSGYTNDQRISLVAGTWSDIGGLLGNIGIAGTALIENATGGAGNDTLIGNTAANELRGGAGNDAIDGSTGVDTAVYGTSYLSATITRNTDGTITLSTSTDGTDTLFNIEQLQFTNATVAAWRFSQAAAPVLNNFAPGAGGWSDDNLYPRHIADMNGDGFADIVGFGTTGVWTSLGNGSGGFSAPTQVSTLFAPTTGWTNDNTYHREVRDMNNDGRADLIGFGQNGVWIVYANGSGGFGAATLAVQNFGVAQGWASQDGYARAVADVNGDGYGDVVGFGFAGTWVSLGGASGTFTAPQLTVSSFGSAQGWTSDDRYHRTLADVNGDGRADIIGFGQSGTWVALANTQNGFSTPFLSTSNFGVTDGWSSNDRYSRYVADVNGDHLADLVGFGQSGTWVALATGGGHFAAATFETNNFGVAQGWSSDNTFHHELADLNGDQRADLFGFGYAGVYVSTSATSWLI